MNRSLLSIASAIGLLVLADAPAWADPTPSPDVQWSYNFSTTPTFVQPDGKTGGSLTFSPQPNVNASNSSDIVLTNLRVSSTASANSPETFGNTGAWQGSLQLTDTASGASTTVDFSGKLGGNFSQYNANVTEQTSISNANVPGGNAYTWTAPNGNKYTVTLGSYTPPGPPQSSSDGPTNAGSISAHVTVTPGSDSGHTSGTAPEPSTLVLSCLGLGFAGLTSRRKRRAARN